jgi:NAD+ synthase (glutamine-hydrolysing)
MPQLRLALAQVDPTVGDLRGNVDLVLDGARRARAAGADLAAFPEMVLTGYPVEDLVFRESFVAASRAALDELAVRLDAEGLGDLPVVVGYLDADGPVAPGVDAGADGGPRNAAAVLAGGHAVTRYFKHHLPNYGVFDEDRYFEPGNTLPIVRLRRAGEDPVDLAVVICEDMWASGGPVTAAGEAGVGVIVAINGSPYERAKTDTRLDLCRRRAAEAGAPLAYVNMTGGQDELVFEGDSMVVAADGEVLARAGQFEEELLLVDLDLPAATGEATGELAGMTVERHTLDLPARERTGPSPEPRIAGLLSDEASVWAALVAGTRDYVRKNGFRSVVLGLSGGIDSALVATIAADAIGAENVVGVSMPSSYSSEHSRSDAAELAERIGLDFRTVLIAPMVSSFLDNLGLTGLAEENLQARVRGVILMGLSNQEGHLVLTTGNKSELAVGYSTLYGDSVGGWNPVKDVFKTMVWRLAEWRNADAESRGETPPIPKNTITKPPSAELRPGQLDTDSLPDYAELDAILAGYVDSDLGRDDLLAAGHDEATVDRVVRMVDLAEYKRRQSAPGPKISLKAFGRDRRLPITNRWREHGV